MRDQTECPNCKKLARELAELRQENATLKRRLDALESEVRRAKRQATPFSRDKKKLNPKKPGRKKGKGVFKHREPPPEDHTKTIEIPLECCPQCGGPLEDRRTHEHIQTDIPLPRPAHTRFVNESGYCPRCKRRFRSRHPHQTSTAAGAAGVSVGPNAKAIAADMHHRLGVPYAKIADHFQTVARLPVTPGALCQSNMRIGHKAEPVYRELVEAIRRTCSVHADETGWRIGILSAWLWVFTSRKITVYTVGSRGHDVIIEVLGRKFKGVLHSDCFLAYDDKSLSAWLQQKCFAHFLKALSKMENEKTRGAVNFPRAVTEVLRSALALRREKRRISKRAFARRFRKMERRLDALIDERRQFTDEDNRRFAKRLRKQRRHLFSFLKHDGVEATNNRAERMLRPAVIVRKTGGCNKTERGAKTHMILSSILVSAKQLRVDAVDYMKSVITSCGPVPSLLAAAPRDTS